MEIPGPRSRELARRLAAVECRAVTYLAEDFPVFWESGAGAAVTDVDGNVYLDLTAAFGVAALGHGDAGVAAAVARQAARLAHGMGDVHPTALKVELAERLAEVAPGGLSRAIFGLSGSDAVEGAAKTAIVATGRAKIVAFEGAYHGLALGALDMTHRDDFRAPFRSRLPLATAFVPFPTRESAREVLAQVEREARDAGMVLVEPIQGRAGVRPLPPGFLTGLRAVCDRTGAVLALDEVMTGLGRTGRWFACDEEGVVPDLICVGKALGGGLPISATLGRPEVMDRWPVSRGEAIHTSTFLGHPLAAAAALEVLSRIERDGLVARAEAMGRRLAAGLGALARRHGLLPVRGRGLMLGLSVGPGRGPEVMKAALVRGLVVLASGSRGETLSITPPLVLGEAEADRAIAILGEALAATL